MRLVGHLVALFLEDVAVLNRLIALFRSMFGKVEAKPVAETSNTLWAVCMNEQKRSCVVLNMEPIDLILWQVENGSHDVKGFNTEPEAREFERKCVDALIRLELANPSTGYMVLTTLVEHAERIGLEILPGIEERIYERYRAMIRGRLSQKKDDPEQPGACTII